MAKTWNQIEKEVKFAAIGELENAMVMAAAGNTMVSFNPILAPNTTAVAYNKDSAKYTIFLKKRLKSFDVDTAITGKTTATGQDDAVLDAFGKVDWESQEMVTGKLRGIGIITGINTKFDSDNIGTIGETELKDGYNSRLIESKERLIKALISKQVAADAGDNLFDPTTIDIQKGVTPIADRLNKNVIDIRKESDVYKHRTAKNHILHIVDNQTFINLRKEGALTTNEIKLYNTEIIIKHSLDGVPVLEVPELDQYKLNSNAEAIGAVSYDLDVLAYAKADLTEKVISVDKGLHQYNGKLYYGIEHLIEVFAKRVKVSTYASAEAAVKEIAA